MTAPLAQQTVQVKDNGAVRKRRRRAPAGGASDDCFTCSKRNVKCDRRRPYCSQCLEVGNECSGYKTQLTWGVGVASRGKLRGLSLPIAKAPPVARDPKKSPSRPRAQSNTTMVAATAAHWHEHDATRRASRGPIDIPVVTQAASAPTTPYPLGGYDYLSIPHPESVGSVPPGPWNNVHYSPGGLMHSPDAAPKYSKFPFPLVTDGLSSVGSMGSDCEYISPLSQTYSREDMPFAASPNMMYESYHTSQTSPVPGSPPASVVLDQNRAPTSCPGLVYAPSEPSSSLNSQLDMFESHLSQKLMRNCDPISVPAPDLFNTPCNSTGANAAWDPQTTPRNNELKSPVSDQSHSHWPSVSEAQGLHVNPDLLAKMPFFMNYYSHTLCPSMVFIDGPNNPFREHILQLANGSQSLRHAICALSACNLRMKRRLSLDREPRQLSEKLRADKHMNDAMIDGGNGDQSVAEEYKHRNLAVHLLNQQLNDSTASCQDSVLATILLLCHYRMVESGIARFHTQFAGVKKILALRRSQQMDSGEPSWMEGLFTYFDAISASINDREPQLVSPPFGMSTDAQLLPNGAENLVGCDRALFKVISKLGRLNLLAQHRPVQGAATTPSAASEPARATSPLGSPLGHTAKDSSGSIHSQQLGDLYNMAGHRFDGNGFGTTLEDDEILASAVGSSAAYDTQRSVFWKEWREARIALQNWQFDSSAVAATMSEAMTPAQLRDIGSLSEAFRYAALLYTERLASPQMSSSHSNLQNLVSQVVYYATSLETGSPAEKFLLWPLFVAGSECVNELQQNIVRSKCSDIMSRSGYMNNLTALDVLEKVWSANAREDEGRSPGSKFSGRRGSFNWTRCISGPDIELEWIMF